MGNFFAGLVVDLRAKVFSISYIEKLKISISLVREALYTRELNGAVPIIGMSIAGCPASFIYS